MIIIIYIIPKIKDNSQTKKLSCVILIGIRVIYEYVDCGGGRAKKLFKNA